jgi:hypothetical protein
LKITAEMQTPQHTLALAVAEDEATTKGLLPGATLQKIVHFELREEGTHVLCVSISYNERIMSKTEHLPFSGRVRSFRKLYQFVALPCLSVRTKATDLKPLEKSADARTAKQLSRYALEAQLENLAVERITLEKLTFEPHKPFASRSVNWDASPHLSTPTLANREVTQVAFLVEEQAAEEGKDEKEAAEAIRNEITKDGRTILGVLTIRWRSAMGTAGVLSTGWLTSRRKVKV